MTAAALIGAFTAFLHASAGATASSLVVPVLQQVAADQISGLIQNPNHDVAHSQTVLTTIQEQYDRFADHQS